MNYPQNPPLPQANVGFSGQVTGKKYWDSDIDWFKFTDRKWHRLRFIGPVHMVAQSWLKSNRNGKRFPVFSLGYNRQTDSYDHEKDPILNEFQPFDSKDEHIKEIAPRKSAFAHAIIREYQKIGNVTNDPAWKPWAAIKVPLTVVRELIALKGMNSFDINGVTYTADMADNYWGRDINVMYNSSAPTPGEKYRVQMSDHTPLTEEELQYLNQLHDWESIIEYPVYEDVKKKLQFNGYYSYLAAAGQMPSGAAPTYDAAAMKDRVLPSAPPPPAMDRTPAPMPPPTAAPSPMAPPPAARSYAPPPAPAPMSAPPSPTHSTPASDPAAGIFENAAAPSAVWGGAAPQSAPSVARPMQARPEMAPPPPSSVAPALDMSRYHPEGLEQAAPAQTPPPQNIPPAASELVLKIVSDESERTFTVKGRAHPVSAAEFGDIAAAYADKLAGDGIKRGLPLKDGTGDVQGIRVLGCYGNYHGDPSCIRCPLRPHCLHV